MVAGFGEWEENRDPGGISSADPDTPLKALPKASRSAIAALGCFICPLRRTRSPRYQIKQPRTIVRGFVTRAGFKPTTACLEGRSSIQLSYRVFTPKRQATAITSMAGKNKKKLDTFGQNHLWR